MTMRPDRRRLNAVPDAPPRAVLYLRQSVSRDDSISLELQETACRDYCARRGYMVTEVIADPGISGRTWKRPGVQRTLDLIETRDADVIVLWRWSRLSRSRKDWAVAVDRVEVAGGSIESATEPVDVTTAAGRLQRGMLAELAAWESEVKGEQWREAQERRRRNGLPHSGGYRPGYRYENKGYSPDPEVAPLVVQAYERYVSGDGFRKVAAWLGAAGVPCRVTGARWSEKGAQRMLDSGWAAGLLSVHDPACGCKNPAGACIRRTYLPAAHEPIIRSKLWATYLAERARRAAEPRRLLSPSTTLSGLVRCGACGYGMRIKQRPQRPAPFYKCEHPGCPQPTSVNQQRALEEAVRFLHSYAHDVGSRAARAVEERSTRTAAKAAAQRLARTLNGLTTEMTTLTREYTRGVIPEAVYRSTLADLAAEEAEAQKALDGALSSSAPAGLSPQQVATALSRWGQLDVAGRNRVCRATLRVVVTRGPWRSSAVAVPVWEWKPPGGR